MFNKYKRIILIALFTLILLGGCWFLVKRGPLGKTGPVGCTQEAKICPDGSAVGRTGLLCEFALCPKSEDLPKGYTLDSYTVEKVLNVACVKNSDCQTPGEYLMISRCPMASLCLKNQCTVVCPEYINSK